MTKERCPKCNSVMFEVEPFKTTQQEIIEFAYSSLLSESEKQSICQDKWMHPGYYCPNDCTRTLVETSLPLPMMTINESIKIATEYAHKYFSEFVQAHGTTSRIIACVFCKNFLGAVLEGESSTAVYHQPKLRPLRNHKVASAYCSEPRIQVLKNQWWYSSGKMHAECDYFEYEPSFEGVYKDITGWSEYPVS